jgi:hypothetical protein
VWRYAEATGNAKWKGLAWGMVPSHASGIAACTYHVFYNAKVIVPLVTLQVSRDTFCCCWRFCWAPRLLFIEPLPPPLDPPLVSALLSEAFLTLLGNAALAFACYRLAVSNGWTLAELDPRLLVDAGANSGGTLFGPSQLLHLLVFLPLSLWQIAVPRAVPRPPRPLPSGATTRRLCRSSRRLSSKRP